MFTWRTDPTLTALQQQRFAELLHAELAEAAGPGRAARLEAGPLAGQGIMHPDCFDLRNVLVQLAAQGDLPEEPVILGALDHCAGAVAASRARAEENAALLGGRFDLSPEFPRALGILRRAVRTRWPERVEDAHLVALRPGALAQVKEALRILRAAWPELLAELESQVTNLLFFDFPGLLGFSGVAYHGGIYLRVEDLADPVKLAENILHEGSHVRLNTAMASVTYFEADEDGRYASPLREDPRPVFGIFHQMFVLGRMLHFYDRAEARLGIQHRQHPVVRRQFQEAHAAVTAHVRLTEAGRRMADAMLDVVGVPA
jgi:hypothetical protein